MQTEVTIEALTNQLNGAKEAQKKLEKLTRLCKNKDFKDLILEDYCVQEAARLLHMSIHPSQSNEERAKFLVMAQATGGVLMYIHAQEQLLNRDISTISDIEDQLDQLRAQPEQADDEEDGEE